MKIKPAALRTAFAMTAWSCAVCAAFAADVKGNASDSAFAPAVTDNSTLVLGVNFTKQQLFKIADNILGLVLKAPGADKQSIGEIQQKIEAFKRDPFAEAPQEAQDFLKECGLRDAWPRWGVLSMQGPLRISDSPDLGQMALAIAMDVDPARLITAIRKETSGDDDTVSFQKIPVAGEDAWRIVSSDSVIRDTMTAMNASLHMASLDGKLLLVATSSSALEKQIRLYREGKGRGDALCGFSAAEGELVHLNVSGVGDVLQEAMPPDAMSGTNEGFMEQVTPIVREIIFGLKTLSADIKVSKEGAFGPVVRLEAASETDAELIRTLMGAVLVIARTFASKAPDAPKEVVNALQGIHIGGLGNGIELRCDDALSILGGSLRPAVASAQLSAKTSAVAMNGRNIFVSITQANTEREAAGLTSVWPRTAVPDDADKDDIAGRAYQKSTDYFRDLLDMSNYGTDKWAPYVSGCDLDVFGKDLDLWCVAANVTDEMPDCIPVLISANFNPEMLPSKWDGSSDRKLPIGPAHGAAKSPWGDKAIVVVAKGGSVHVIKAKALSYKSLYGGQAFDLTDAEPPVVYLTPKGVRTTRSR